MLENRTGTPTGGGRIPNTAPVERELPPKDFVRRLLKPLHDIYTSQAQRLIARRAQALADAHSGLLPEYPAPNATVSRNWVCEVPKWAHSPVSDLPGPLDDPNRVAELFNSEPSGPVLDLEDTMANNWPSLVRGLTNAVLALHGDLDFQDPFKGVRKVQDDQEVKPTLIRVRGLHLSQAGILLDEHVSAPIFDLAWIFYEMKVRKLRGPVVIFIPKSEHADEGIWWNELLSSLEEWKGIPKGTFKVVGLVEAHPLAFQLDQFIWNLRERIIGLSFGRWDYMASLIDHLRKDPSWVLPDLNSISDDIAVTRVVQELIARTCRRRGIRAVGENRGDEHALEVRPDLRPPLDGTGNFTLGWTRTAIRTCIRYAFRVQSGIHYQPLDDRADDLAIYRLFLLMIRQRIDHHAKTHIFGPDRRPFPLSEKAVSDIFDVELAKLVKEQRRDHETRGLLQSARDTSLALILNEEFTPI